MSTKLVRLTGLFISVLMLAGSFIGCTSRENNDAAGTTTASQQSAAAGEETVSQGYTPQKTLELTVWNTQGTDVQAVDKPKEDIPGDWLFEKTKTKITEFYGNSGQQWEPKLTTLVASGNLPNLVLTQGGQGPAQHAKLREGELNWELTPEMIQKYAPDVWKFVPQYVWDKLKIDGKIYGIPFSFDVDRDIDPNLDDDFLSAFSVLKNKIAPSSRLVVRDDILKTLLPEAKNYDELMKLVNEKNALMGDSFILPIKSSDEYIKFMYDIQALGLKEGNKPVYATGYNGGDNWFSLCILGGDMMGFKGYNYTGYLKYPEKRMEFGYLDPVFKEAARIQNKMINDKVIDPESLVHNAEKYKEKLMNGQYAIAWMDVTGFPSITALNDELQKAGKSFRFVPFYTQVPQLEDYPVYKEGPRSFKETLSLMKTLKEEEVYQVLNWINTMFTEEWEEIKFWGTKEAALYEELPDGKRKFKDEKLQKFLVEGDTSAMDYKDAKGLNFNNILYSGGSPGYWKGVSKWEGNGVSVYNPQYVNKSIKYSTIDMAMRFPASSPWTQDLVPVPNIQGYSAEYANIPEIQKLWSTRASWDDPFKIAFTAKNEEEFNKKWDEAVVNLRKVVDVDKMLEEQTKIMLPLLEQRTQQGK